MMNDVYEIYTDGAYSNKLRLGGWGALIIKDDLIEEIFDGERNSTNNRMEMKAAIYALQNVPIGSNIVLYSDSQYLIKGITNWIKKWKKNNWKTGKDEVKNIDLWKRLDVLNSKNSISWKWVKGHNGNKYNEKADKLASRGMKLLNGKK